MFINHDDNEMDRTDTVFTKLLLFSSSDLKKELDEAWVSMTVGDTQPFSIAEDQGFREFEAKLDPTYVIPTRKVCLVKKYEGSFTYKKQTTIFFFSIRL